MCHLGARLTVTPAPKKAEIDNEYSCLQKIGNHTFIYIKKTSMYIFM